MKKSLLVLGTFLVILAVIYGVNAAQNRVSLNEPAPFPVEM